MNKSQAMQDIEREAKDAKDHRTPFVSAGPRLSIRLRFCSKAVFPLSAFLGGVGGGFARTDEGMNAIAVVDFWIVAGDPTGDAFALPFGFTCA
jgi:hypothetical protein